jgi:polar amino acid transport system substrate-binding protein
MIRCQFSLRFALVLLTGLAPITLEATLLPSSSAALSTQTLPTKVLRWAADTSSGAPYVFQDPTDPTKLVGFEVDLIDALAAELSGMV